MTNFKIEKKEEKKNGKSVSQKPGATLFLIKTTTHLANTATGITLYQKEKILVYGLEYFSKPYIDQD